MSGTWIKWVALIGVLISSTQSSEENCNATSSTTSQIIVTESEALKKIEIRNPSNGTSSHFPTVIQQGNNLFIKPQFILGSPFTFYKEGHMKNAEGVSVISKTPGFDPSTMVNKSELPQPPKILVPPPPRPPILPVLPPPPTLPPLPSHLPPPPPVVIPAAVTHNIPPPINSIPNPIQKVPIQNLPHLPAPLILGGKPPEMLPPVVPKLPTQVIPIHPHSPPLPAPPILVQKPVYPVISKPLPPVVPKLPTQVIPIHPHSPPLPAPPILVQKPVYPVISKPLPPVVPELPIQMIPIQPHFPRLPAPPLLVHKPVYPIMLKPPQALLPVLPKLPIQIIPIQPHFQRLSVPPILLRKPIYPVLAKLPRVPPLVVPKIPIQVIVQTPNISTPEQRIQIAPCPMPCPKCESGTESPFNVLLNDLTKKFRGMMNDVYGSNTTTTTEAPNDEETEKNMTDTTLCPQGIITERVVPPNIITNNNIKVVLTPVSPYQMAHFNKYKK